MPHQLTKTEESLLKALLNGAPGSYRKPDMKKIWAEALEDGGMGSVRLYKQDSAPSSEKRKFGRCLSEIKFLDSDGVIVIASLYLDKNDQLFEIDIWKTDFGPVRKIPSNLDSLTED